MLNLTLSEIELSNVIVALEDRADYLRTEIKELEEADWTIQLAGLQQDLAAVRGLLKRLGAE